MKESICERTRLWFCERSHLRDDLAQLVLRRFGPRPVEVFASAEEARDYLRGQGIGDSFSPGILVTDWIGYGGAEPDQPPVVQTFRQRYPLLLTALFTSRLDTHAAEVDRYRQLNLLDRPFHKSQTEELMGTLGVWVEQSEQPFSQRFRAYIASLGERATAPYLNDGKGGWLSLVDLYREAILCTQKGRQVEKVWGRILGAQREAPPAAPRQE